MSSRQERRAEARSSAKREGGGEGGGTGSNGTHQQQRQRQHEHNVIMRSDVLNKYHYVMKFVDDDKADICIAWHRQQRAFQDLREVDVKQQWRLWEDDIKQGKCDMLAVNNVTKNSPDGRVWHICVASTTDEKDNEPDAFGLMIIGFFVSGHIYAFIDKTKRDQYYQVFQDMKKTQPQQ